MSAESTKTATECKRICKHFVGSAGLMWCEPQVLYWRWTIYLALGIDRGDLR